LVRLGSIRPDLVRVDEVRVVGRLVPGSNAAGTVGRGGRK
jgi:hypothetical protein